MRAGIMLLAASAVVAGVAVTRTIWQDDPPYVITQPAPITVQPVSYDQAD